MINLNNTVVKDVLKNVSNKQKKCYDNRELLEQWSYCCTNQENQFILDVSAYETAQAIQSISKYIKDKASISNSTYNYAARQIIMVDLGLSAKNLCYWHPCVVIADLQNKIFVVPCTSGPAPRIIKKDGTEEVRNGYLEGNTGDGFDHLTTLILREAKCIDKSQVVYVIKDNNNNVKKRVEANFFKKIYDELFKVLMEGKAKYIENKEQELLDANKKIEDLTNDIEVLKAELETVKSQLESKCDDNEAAMGDVTDNIDSVE